MNQAAAVLWAQWRTFRNQYDKGIVWFSIVLSAIWYCAWIFGAIVAGLGMADPDPTVERALPGALFLVTLYWQLIPLLMAAGGLSLDLGKLKPYPISTSQLFGIELMLRSTAALEVLVLMIGAATGVLFNPSLPKWGSLGVIPFILMHMCLALGIRDVLVRLLNTRRIREIVAILFVGLMTIPRLFIRPGGAVFRNFFTNGFALATVSNAAPVWPWTATANLLTGHDFFVSSATMLAWTALAAAFALWQFRRTLAFDVEEARSGGSGQAPIASATTGFTERLYRFPSRLLADPLGAILEKEIRYMARSPRFRMLFLTACALSLVITRGLTRNATVTWAPSFLTGASAYSLLLLGEVCIWNIFGFDRGATQIYFLAPVPFKRVLIAKNMNAALWIALQLTCAATLAALLKFPVTPLVIAEAASVTGAVGLFLVSAGNFVSVRNARPADSQKSMRSRAPGGSQMLLILLYPVVFIPVAVAYLARWFFGTELAFFGVMGIIGIIGAVVYAVTLDTAAEQADQRKEAMVAALSAGQGPISN